MRNTKNSIHTPTSSMCVCVCRLAIVPFGFPIIICFHCTVTMCSIVHLHTFAPHTPQLGDFCVVLCFVTFFAHFSLNDSLADNSVVSLSMCLCAIIFYLVEIGFRPEPNTFKRVKENDNNNYNQPSFL